MLFGKYLLSSFVVVVLASMIPLTEGEGGSSGKGSSSSRRGPRIVAKASGAQEVPTPVDTETAARIVLKFAKDFSSVYYDLDGK